MLKELELGSIPSIEKSKYHFIRKLCDAMQAFMRWTLPFHAHLFPPPPICSFPFYSALHCSAPYCRTYRALLLLAELIDWWTVLQLTAWLLYIYLLLRLFSLFFSSLLSFLLSSLFYFFIVSALLGWSILTTLCYLLINIISLIQIGYLQSPIIIRTVQ